MDPINYPDNFRDQIFALFPSCVPSKHIDNVYFLPGMAGEIRVCLLIPFKMACLSYIPLENHQFMPLIAMLNGWVNASMLHLQSFPSRHTLAHHTS